MPVRMRATVSATGDRVAELRTAADLRRDLWAHSPVEIDPDHPLHGTHRDESRRAYFEFATEFPDEVRRVVHQYHYTNKVEVTETPTLPGEECVNCGNVAGPVRPTVCPNCDFRDISPCPVCGQEISRQQYTRISGDLFRCPRCNSRVRLRFNSPMFLPDGTYNQPLVVIEEATTLHEV
jgi:DNA-directed RNA polymerase subunit RPC12/RpoP